MTHRISHKEHCQTLIDCVQDGEPGLPSCVYLGAPSFAIELLLFDEGTHTEVLVSNGHHHDRKRSVDKVKDKEVDAVDDSTTGKCTKELKPKEKKSIGLQGRGGGVWRKEECVCVCVCVGRMKGGKGERERIRRL